MMFATRTETYDAVERYVDGLYNPTRRHSLLAYVSLLHHELKGGAVAA